MSVGSGRKGLEKEPPPSPCCPVNLECLWKKTQMEKKKEFTYSACEPFTKHKER